MKLKSKSPRASVLIEILDQAFDKRAWHGTNLRGSLRGLKPKDYSGGH